MSPHTCSLSAHIAAYGVEFESARRGPQSRPFTLGIQAATVYIFETMIAQCVMSEVFLLEMNNHILLECIYSYSQKHLSAKKRSAQIKK